MADQSDDYLPEFEEEEGGGPVKSFLEHLEDLRWTLIKTVAAVGIGMVFCLFTCNRIMEILKRPLEKASMLQPPPGNLLLLRIGTNWLPPFHPGSNQLAGIEMTNRVTAFELIPTLQGTNLLLALRPSTATPPLDLTGNKVTLINLGPAQAFAISFKLAIYGGIFLASPFVIYFIAQFVLPALKMNEKKYILRGFAIGTFLFLVGALFCYFVVMPFALRAAVMWSNWMTFAADQWTGEEYISFICKFMLGMGLGFEMPIPILILVKLGILDYKKLAAFRRYMIVINLILGAVLTTPEVLTQIIMAVPLQLLYEITVWIAWYWERKEKKRMAAEGISSE